MKTQTGTDALTFAEFNLRRAFNQRCAEYASALVMATNTLPREPGDPYRANVHRPAMGKVLAATRELLARGVQPLDYASASWLVAKVVALDASPAIDDIDRKRLRQVAAYFSEAMTKNAVEVYG